jgi:transcriptional regulator with XRE-family HTH domain
MNEVFGTLLRRAREQKGYSIEMVSKAVGLTEAHLASFENNRLVPLPEEIEKLIDYLDVDIDSASQIRRSMGTQIFVPDSAWGIQILSESKGGIHPWAQTIFATEISTEGPRKSALGYLSARVRPIELTLKQYLWDGVSDDDLDSIRDLLIKRRDSWLRTLEVFRCQEIYPKLWIEKYCRERRWFGQTLSRSDVIAHLMAIEAELVQYPNYEIGLLTGEELYFNFIIQGPYVLVEGGYETEPKPAHRVVGGIRISIPEVVRSFDSEFERMWNSIPEPDRDREKIIAWLRDQRKQLE